MCLPESGRFRFSVDPSGFGWFLWSSKFVQALIGVFFSANVYWSSSTPSQRFLGFKKSASARRIPRGGIELSVVDTLKILKEFLFFCNGICL